MPDTIIDIRGLSLVYGTGERRNVVLDALDLDELRDPAITFCVARAADGTLLGVGALKELDDPAEFSQFVSTTASGAFYKQQLEEATPTPTPTASPTPSE